MTVLGVPSCFRSYFRSYLRSYLRSYFSCCCYRCPTKEKVREGDEEEEEQQQLKEGERLDCGSASM